MSGRVRGIWIMKGRSIFFCYRSLSADSYVHMQDPFLPSADDFASWRSEFTRRYFHGMLARIEDPLAGHVSRIFPRLGSLSIQNQAFAVQVLRRNLREIEERAAQIEG